MEAIYDLMGLPIDQVLFSTSKQHIESNQNELFVGKVPVV
jgi:hypothetical protein